MVSAVHTLRKSPLPQHLMPGDATLLRFVQLNVNKSNTSQSALLHNVADFDLVFLQEPHIDFLNNTRASQQWRVIYPPKHKDSPTRAHAQSP